ncbi:MAG: M3 family oligoendopeptidase [Armatimonadetes bacterium]|nr:M3 family oligoendopeptidase [Armatimonadota bacterium]
MSTITKLPRWDVTPYFPGIDSPDFRQALTDLREQALDLERLYDRVGVLAGDDVAMSESLAAEVEGVIEAVNAVSDRLKLLESYIHSFVTTDSSDDVALAKQSELQATIILMNKLSTRLTAWVGRLPLDALVPSSDVLESHEFALRRMKTLSEKMMSPDEEALSADLSEAGGSAWARLYGNFASQIKVEFQGEGIPVSAVRNFAHDADQSVRRAAYEKELEAWKENELVIASAMNAIKYESDFITRKRGWSTVLDEAVFATNIDRETLDAMMEAARDSFPVMRRYLKAKSRLLGNSGALPWFDLFAPVGEGGSWTYERAQSFVEEGFRAYSDKMGDLAVRSYGENWIDVEPRPGKRDGAFCMGTRDDESRILMNYKSSFSAVSTLAHELGHAYHNVCLADRTAMQSSGTPMTLAETASIFCETVIKRRALAGTEGAEKMAILEASLQGANQVVVDITSRFIFEQTVFEKRAERELSAREFCEIMTGAQIETYGDGLDPAFLHPYMWAVKPHYYAWRPFYNYPYMFGQLFSLGLYAVYQAEPSGFHARYDDLLSSTGMATAAELGDRFGIDVRTKEFWAGSLRVIAEDVLEFESLAGS